MKTITKYIPEIGDTLTVCHDIIDIAANIILNKGQKVKVRSVHVMEGHYHSQIHDLFIQEQLLTINLVNVYGSWVPSTFEETLKS